MHSILFFWLRPHDVCHCHSVRPNKYYMTFFFFIVAYVFWQVNQLTLRMNWPNSSFIHIFPCHIINICMRRQSTEPTMIVIVTIWEMKQVRIKFSFFFFSLWKCHHLFPENKCKWIICPIRHGIHSVSSIFSHAFTLRMVEALKVQYGIRTTFDLAHKR